MSSSEEVVHAEIGASIRAFLRHSLQLLTHRRPPEGFYMDLHEFYQNYKDIVTPAALLLRFLASFPDAVSTAWESVFSDVLHHRSSRSSRDSRHHEMEVFLLVLVGHHAIAADLPSLVRLRSRLSHSALGFPPLPPTVQAVVRETLAASPLRAALLHDDAGQEAAPEAELDPSVDEASLRSLHAVLAETGYVTVTDVFVPPPQHGAAKPLAAESGSERDLCAGYAAFTAADAAYARHLGALETAVGAGADATVSYEDVVEAHKAFAAAGAQLERSATAALRIVLKSMFVSLSKDS